MRYGTRASCDSANEKTVPSTPLRVQLNSERSADSEAEQGSPRFNCQNKEKPQASVPTFTNTPQKGGSGAGCDGPDGAIGVHINFEHAKLL